MMYTNTAMTLFNHYLNDHQEDCYQKVILNQVFWNNDEGANVIKMGLEAADKATVFIPLDIAAKDGKIYCTAKDFQRLAHEEKNNYWTLQIGDKMLCGALELEITADTIISELDQLLDGVMTITRIDKKDFGSRFMRHWEVGGV